MPRPLLRRVLKIGLASVVVLPPASLASWYALKASPKQQDLLSEVFSLVPVILQGGAKRLVTSLATGLVVSLDYKISLRGLDEETEDYADAISQVHTRSARRILKTCLSHGGLYVKFGQGLVSMNHVLPREYLDELKVLQDKCLKRDNEHEIDDIFQEDFGCTPEQAFAQFNRKPIAAASLAQVFKAETFDNETVAVKIQYKDLRDRFDSDVSTMQTTLNLIEVMHPKFGFGWVLKELKGNFAKELNFIEEGQNSERCSKDLKHLDFVYVPKVKWNLCSKRVLTTEFIHGIKITDTDKLNDSSFSMQDIGEKLIKTFAEQIFHTGFVHADPHPGNLLIRRKSNSTKNNAEIVILDHGLYEEIPVQSRQALCKIWKAVVEGDYPAMKEGCSTLGVEDYRLFCMVLTQRYVKPPKHEPMDALTKFLEERGPKAFSRREFNKLPEDEKANIRAELILFHDRMFDVFQKIPGHLMLIFRNLNTIRAIIKDHGKIVDRYPIMARSATKGVFVHDNAGVIDWTLGHWSQFLFDLRLLVDSVKMLLISLAMRLALTFGVFDQLSSVKSQTGVQVLDVHA